MIRALIFLGAPFHFLRDCLYLAVSTFILAVMSSYAALSSGDNVSSNANDPSKSPSISKAKASLNTTCGFTIALLLTRPLSLCFDTSATKLSAITIPSISWLFSNALLISLSGSFSSLFIISKPYSSANALDRDSLRPLITSPSLNK